MEGCVARCPLLPLTLQTPSNVLSLGPVLAAPRRSQWTRSATEGGLAGACCLSPRLVLGETRLGWALVTQPVKPLKPWPLAGRVHLWEARSAPQEPQMAPAPSLHF